MNSSDSKKKTSDWKNVLKELKETFQVWSPPPRLTVTEWSEQFRRLSTEASSMPGMFRIELAPYQA